jgi:hypothetical protein
MGKYVTSSSYVKIEALLRNHIVWTLGMKVNPKERGDPVFDGPHYFLSWRSRHHQIACRNLNSEISFLWQVQNFCLAIIRTIPEGPNLELAVCDQTEFLIGGSYYGIYL